jgi:AraC family transcriptional regulator
MLKELNCVIEIIEEQLLEDIDIKSLARESGVSEYHLKRTFCLLAGVSIPEYIKNRRLALANSEIANGLSVTDAAFKYGFQSVEGFSRSFKSWSGFSPSEAKQAGRQKSYPPLKFIIDVKGGISMEFRIEEKGAFNLVGVSKRVPIKFEGENSVIMELAQSITEEQGAHMHELGDLYPQQVVNASYDFDEERLQEKGKLTQMIGFITSKENPFDDLETVSVPAHTWAVFPNQGAFPQTLQETWANAFAEWLPSSDYELIEAPEISFTKWGEDPVNVYSEIWLAVSPKQ